MVDFIQDRFTKDLVVVAAQTKPKTGGYELQLPSMGSLTSKTSSQAFFLRILKVILQLRDAARLAAAKAKRKQTETLTDSSSTLVASTSSSTATPSTDMSLPSSGDSAAVAAVAAASAAAATLLPPPPPPPAAAAAVALPVPVAPAAPATVPIETNTAEVPAPMEVDEVGNTKEIELPRMSQQLLLDSLWNTLSECLQVCNSIFYPIFSLVIIFKKFN